jgi:hypothetical protein
VKFKHDDIKRTHYRSWKSRKRWLYASGALAALLGGTVLEIGGVTPQVLKYIREDLGDTVAHAISSVASILPRGSVLPTDFYASVDNFTVPTTVAQDFANNATTSKIGSISPYWSGNTYVIPSAENSNAIANFNQPLDPSKDFSISGKVTVPDAGIAAAGFYISDVPPSDIVKKLGTGDHNGPGSSGALANNTSAYNGHYMFFSGFHNAGAFVAILSSGTDYERVTKVGTPRPGGSGYVDNDYVGLWWEKYNVVVDVKISYVAATGIVTVSYKHNSASTDGGTGVYDAKTKSATVQYRINNHSPVYLGIVGNGDKNDNNGQFTSRSTVTSITGSYLTTNRTIEFRDDAGNKLAPYSKVLMPRGGRLGIGNGDATVPYYFGAPDMPSGYTYLASLNPTTYVGEATTSSGYVTYQRDKQQGRINHVNHLTGNTISTDTWNALTNEVINNNTDAQTGYYIIDKDAVIGRGVSNVTTAADGSKVSWTNTVDNTANGTSPTDSDPQEANIDIMPSVQERILTITKPDGTQTTEAQLSTTGTDFSPLAGQYAIPGYRAVIDGNPVSDAEVLQGIPGEATDKTHNLKSQTDKTPQRHTITYQAEPQKAMIIYQDATTGTVLKTDTINGLTDQMMSYDPASSIANYGTQGYVLKTNNFKTGSEKFDTDTSTDQTYLVELVHDSRNLVESKTINHEVTYSVKLGQATAPQQYVTQAKITYDYFVDQVTGTKITSNFTDYAFNSTLVLKPKAPNYQSNHPDAAVTQDGQIKFASPLVPTLQGYLPTVSEDTTVHYNNASDGHVLRSSVLYQLDDRINVTIPTDAIFYNTKADTRIKSPTYKITNHSGLPLKVSVDGFTSDANNPSLPADFDLNLNLKGKQVTTASAKLVEKGTLQTSPTELATLANCFDQYAAADTAIDKHLAVDNVASFTYGGATQTTSNAMKLAYTLSLKFDSVNF